MNESRENVIMFFLQKISQGYVYSNTYPLNRQISLSYPFQIAFLSVLEAILKIFLENTYFLSNS